jgi:hypothetical protein
MEELVSYDSNVVVGILGGSAGTTYDAFKLLTEAKKYGARAALYGRKINQAENQFAFIRILRLLADGVLSAEEGVRAYHGVLQKLGVKPHRTLEQDSQLRTGVMKYAPAGTSVVVPEQVAALDWTGPTAPAPAAVSTPTAMPTVAGKSSPWSPPAVRTDSAKPLVTMSHSLHPTLVAPTSPSKKSCGASGECHCGCSGMPTDTPSFASMSNQERLAYHLDRIARLLGDKRASAPSAGGK